MSGDPGLDEMRTRLRELDRDLAGLAAERVRLVRELGERKRARGLPIRDFEVEREAVDNVRAACEAAGVAPDVGEDLVTRLIREALRVQERDAHEARDLGDGAPALVVGGAGAMGRWFTAFLRSAGYRVLVVDPAGEVPGTEHRDDLEAAAAEAELVLVATPPGAVDAVLERITPHVGDALVVDIASIKAPFQERLRAMADDGLRVASLHPMWGPDADLLADKNLLVCDAGSPEAAAAARDLFEHTAVRVLDLPLGEHDDVVTWTLVLPHAANLAVADALRRSGRAHRELAHHGGPTFERTAAIARGVVHESPGLYHEIQALHPRTPGFYDELRGSLDALREDLDDPAGFRERMLAARRWFDEDEGGEG